MEKTRYRKKKRSGWKAFLLALVLIIGARAAFTYFQYRQGVEESLKKIDRTKEETYEFSGQKDRYGGTNVLILGRDTAGGKRNRSDTIMIVHYHEDKGSFKLTSIMRDSYVEIPGYGMRKINQAFALGGPELMRQTIKENFEIDLQYYTILDFEGFVSVIDEAFPDGVEINVEKRMTEYIHPPLEPGLQRLDGRHLLSYVRFRQDAVGDFGRVERQQKVVGEIGSQLKSIQTIPKLPKLVGVLMPYVNTNMKASNIIFMGKDFLDKDRGQLETLRIPVDNGYADQRVPGQGLVLAIDLEKNREALHEFIQK